MKMGMKQAYLTRGYKRMLQLIREIRVDRLSPKMEK